VRGSIAFIQIAVPIMDAAQARLDQQVDVREEWGFIITEPAGAPDYDLTTLVAGITDEDRYGLLPQDEQPIPRRAPH
jgi:hypothetical protein